jgi:hypothetical protein
MSKVTWRIVEGKKPQSPYKWRKGYKVFEQFDHHADGSVTTVTRFPHQHYNQLGNQADYVSVPLNEVLKAKPGKIPTHNSEYPAGFHVFPSPMAAALYQPRRDSFKVFDVEYRKIVAQGEHNLFTKFPTDCVVALELRVIGPHNFDDPKHAKHVKKLRRDAHA